MVSNISREDSEDPNVNGDFRSINTYFFDIVASRRDDLESIGYILIYFLRGNLPWLRVNLPWLGIGEIEMMKLDTPVDVLCQGHPIEFAIYINYCRGLRFDENPDYAFQRRLFEELFDNQGFKRDFIYDWTQPKQIPA